MLYKHQLNDFQVILLCKAYNLVHPFPRTRSLQDLASESNPCGTSSLMLLLLTSPSSTAEHEIPSPNLPTPKKLGALVCQKQNHTSFKKGFVSRGSQQLVFRITLQNRPASLWQAIYEPSPSQATTLNYKNPSLPSSLNHSPLYKELYQSRKAESLCGPELLYIICLPLASG